MIEHRDGFSCSDMEDRVDDLERELGSAYRSLAQIADWLSVALETDDDFHNHIGLVEDALNEAREQVRIR